MTDPTNLHQDSVTKLLDFLKQEMDAGRVAALSIVAVSQKKDVFRETWVAPNGAAGYTLIGAIDVEKAELREQFFQPGRCDASGNSC